MGSMVRTKVTKNTSLEVPVEFKQDDWTPTGILRFVERSERPCGDVGRPPVVIRVLQQLWARTECKKIAEWRDVPTEGGDWTEGGRYAEQRSSARSEPAPFSRRRTLGHWRN